MSELKDNIELRGRGRKCKNKKGDVLENTNQDTSDEHKDGGNICNEGKQIKSQDLSNLLAELKANQKSSELNMATSIKQAIDESKCEIKESMNTMILALTTSVDEIKSDISKMESAFSSRIGNVEKKVTQIVVDLDEASAGVKEVKLQMNANKISIDTKVSEINKEIQRIKDTSRKEISNVREETKTLLTEQQNIIERQQEELEYWRKHQEHELDNVKTRAYGNSNQIRQHTIQIDDLENKVRAGNIIVEGLQEKDNDENALDDLITIIQKTLPAFQKTSVKHVLRLGKERKNKKKPRPLLVILDSQKTREMLLSNASEIKKNADEKMLWINRDQSENAKRRHSLVKACYKLLLKNSFACSMKGSTITYQKKQYNYDMLNLLPEPCTPQWVKSRTTSDGKGICYSSEHSYCSNFAPATIRHNGCLFTSVEHAFQLSKVKDAGYTELAAEMAGMTNPYNIKYIGDGITASKEWKNEEEQIMEELIRKKFQQNERLRKKLLGDGYSDYYEMTADKRWATGTRIQASTNTVDTKSLKGTNLQGQIVKRIKDELLRIYGDPIPIRRISQSTENQADCAGTDSRETSRDTDTGHISAEAAVSTDD